MTVADPLLPPSGRQYRFLGVITIAYVVAQLVSDVTAGKVIELFGSPVSATVLYFPVTFIIADVLTEVYGYARARAVLWTVMFASIAAGLVYQVVVWLPASPTFDGDAAYARVLGQVPQVIIGGWMAVFAGDTVNNLIMAKLKVLTRGRHLWLRTISSTAAGQLVNTALFYSIGLYGVLPHDVLVRAIVAGWLLKTAVEAILTPVTYFVVRTLKRLENEDFYDTDTNFNPLIVDRPI
jgi:uncharacterized integral membrane protein (TIGR00697 family)